MDIFSPVNPARRTDWNEIWPRDLFLAAHSHASFSLAPCRERAVQGTEGVYVPLDWNHLSGRCRHERL